MIHVQDTDHACTKAGNPIFTNYLNLLLTSSTKPVSIQGLSHTCLTDITLWKNILFYIMWKGPYDMSWENGVVTCHRKMSHHVSWEKGIMVWHCKGVL